MRWAKLAKTLVIKLDNRILYSVIALAVAAIVILNVYAFFIADKGAAASNKGSVANTAENFNAFKAAENPEDKCATPPGYTEEKWREHMGHHPDQYAECL